MHIHDILRKRLHERAGLVEAPPPRFTNLEELYATEWSKEFETLMRNRLVMGALRYGTIKDNKAKKAAYKRVASCIKRLIEYEKTGNDELLVDVANLCLLEFLMGSHPNKHFAAVDDRKDHVAK